MHPTRQAAEPDRKFPLIDMPTGLWPPWSRGVLIASCFVGSFDELAVLEPRARRSGASRG